ncbi:hypothetical protein PGB28_08450 [Primorskyibacter aestuariivivens]|uniref:hypothetical protein n=1 Tax=Primorskyibacter aestuariivivens TaxID=1888912 RepID=UPI0023006E08|nr:hypothetical protein [Primorskyibacter aestuariivivens]MDA7428488.1 hypothetical protein [Primorskyibacter aestuariivivens]
MGVTPVRSEQGGMIFDVRMRNGHAEAIRRNFFWPVRMTDIANNGGRAIEAVNGCRVAWMQGDPSVLMAGVDCGAGAPRKPRRKLVCSGRAGAPSSTGESDVQFTCG